MTDLVFRQGPLSAPADLVFGEVDQVADATITISGALPPPVLSAQIGPLYALSVEAALPDPVVGVALAPAIDLTVDAALPGPGFAMSVKWDSDCQRPLVGRAATRHQVAQPTPVGALHGMQSTKLLSTGPAASWQDADPREAAVRSATQDGDRLRVTASAFMQRAAARRDQIVVPYQDGIRRPQRLSSRHQDAAHLRLDSRVRWQDMLHRRTSHIEHGQEGQPLRRQRDDSIRSGQHAVAGRRARHQEAWIPRPGRHVYLPVEPHDVCYTPSPNLLFAAAPGDSQLLFVCERIAPSQGETIIVPVREVYMIVNSAGLVRVDTGAAVPCMALSLSLDVDSWAWGFQATLPASALSQVEPVAFGEPVELLATVNGTAIRLVVESISRDRTWTKEYLRIQGRGRTAFLDAPYLPISIFSETAEARTSQQLADLAMPFGWSVDWGLTAWLVSAGAWSHQGTPLTAVNAIAAAGGGYLQPHATDPVLRVLPRYPLAPWDWGAVVADYELPSSFTQREAIDWVDKPIYNRVFVSGQGQGILGQITRTGTAGDLVAPMITDALITDIDAARQRAMPILSDVGRQARVVLRTPVMSGVGIIPPGKWVRYVDGATERLGLARAVSVDVGEVEAWQSITVETHE